MRLTLIASLLVLGCGGSSTTPPVDMAHAADLATANNNVDMTPAGPTLTVNNTDGWCKVVVTVGSAAAVTFDGTSDSFPATAGTVVMLTATPHPTFADVKWTGVTTMNASMATYTMTSDAVQTVTACCPFANGTGC